jgi:4-hydroxy-3-polyprenylbenzoate decarboxylase
MYNSLGDFIDHLHKKQDLVIVKRPVSTILEMTEIQQRLIHNNGPAVLFENVINEYGSCDKKVLINLFGTVDRVAQGLNRNKEQLREFGKLLAFLRQPKAPANLKQTASLFPILKKILAMRPKTISTAPCQEIVKLGNDIDLTTLPIQTCWPNEPAPLITWPLVVTKQFPESDISQYNLGIYRMQVTGKNTTLMRWLNHRGGADHFRNWKKLAGHSSMPVAAVIGADPATILAAVTPIPENFSEYQFAGLIREKPIELVECKTVPLKVPAHAEIVLEGHVSFDESGDEGPYGDHTGYYNNIEKFPVFTITAITSRSNPIYLSTYTGRPPDEPSILGEALNEVFIPLIQQQFPEIVDCWLPPEGCSYRVAVISIKKSYPGHARRIMMGLWGFLRQFTYTKFVIIVDENINCRNWQEVIWAMSTKMDPARDIVLIDNTPIDYLDFASPTSELGSKVGFDATDKIFPETSREWGNEIKMEQSIIDKVTANWHEYGFTSKFEGK